MGAPEVDFAVERAIQRAQQSVTDAYLRAETVGAVLLAAALAEDDEFGFFGRRRHDAMPPTSGRACCRPRSDGAELPFATRLLPPYASCAPSPTDGKANDLFTATAPAKGG